MAYSTGWNFVAVPAGRRCGSRLARGVVAGGRFAGRLHYAPVDCLHSILPVGHMEKAVVRRSLCSRAADFGFHTTGAFSVGAIFVHGAFRVLIGTGRESVRRGS